MDATFVQAGDSIDYTPGSDVAAGSVVILNDLVAVATRPITANTLGALTVSGIFDFTKKADEAIDAGTKVYWDSTNGYATATSTDNTYIGKATADAAAADATVRVRMSQ